MDGHGKPCPHRKGLPRFRVEQEGTENVREANIGDIHDFPNDRLKFLEDGVLWF